MDIFKSIAVYGGGSWGTALACQISKRFSKVDLFIRNTNVINEILYYNTNSEYLNNIKLPKGIIPLDNLSKIVNKEVIVVAVPSQAIKSVLNSFKEAKISQDTLLLIAAKGFISNPACLVSEYVKCSLPNKLAFIAGPNFAKEVAQGMFTSVTIASEDINCARKLAKSLVTKNFEVNITDDVITIQVAGALKNIIAIMSGVYTAKGYGDNARASLITKGMQEIKILSEALGGKSDTLLSNAVIGDLVLTCYSKVSRNTTFGYELEKKKNIKELLISYPYLTEGIESTKLAIEWIRKHKLDLPIIISIARKLKLFK